MKRIKKYHTTKTKKNKKHKKMKKNNKKSKRVNTTKSVNYKKMYKGGSIDIFKNNISNSVKIGQGGYGSVYIDPSQPENVFKQSKSSCTCKTWTRESIIYNKLNTFNINTSNVKILKMIDYYNDDQMCIMELTRAFNPLGQDNKYTIQVLFGNNDEEQLYDNRGLFLGVNKIIEYNIINKNELNSYIQNLAIVLSRLHFIAKNDCFDVELFLSKEKDGIIVYFGDFDQSLFIDNFTDEIINDRIIWGMCAIEYFPTPKQSFYELFKNEYIKEAERHNCGDIATKIIQKYEEYF